MITTAIVTLVTWLCVAFGGTYAVKQRTPEDAQGLVPWTTTGLLIAIGGSIVTMTIAIIKAALS